MYIRYSNVQHVVYYFISSSVVILTSVVIAISMSFVRSSSSYFVCPFMSRIRVSLRNCSDCCQLTQIRAPVPFPATARRHQHLNAIDVVVRVLFRTRRKEGRDTDAWPKTTTHSLPIIISHYAMYLCYHEEKAIFLSRRRWWHICMICF